MAKIRVWKLGDRERGLVASQVHIHQFAEALATWDGKNDLDIVWDGCIDVQVQEIKPEDLHLVVPDDLEIAREGNVLRIHKKEGTAHVSQSH